MFDYGITTYILAIIWFFSILLILAALNTGHSSGRVTLIVAIILSVFFVLVPEESLQDIADSFHSNVFIPFPATVISTTIGLLVAYIYLFSYVSVYMPEDPPPKLKRPGKKN